MDRERQRFNRKRKICPDPELGELTALAEAVCYGGNPEHKRDPGDFGLHPPSQPRPHKTLCDGASIFTRHEAERLLREGMRRGLVSVQWRERFPQNVWAVTADGTPLEAQLENAETGVYHGYPMPTTNPLREDVLRYWARNP